MPSQAVDAQAIGFGRGFANRLTALRAIDAARAGVRAQAWQLACEHVPDHDIDASRPLVIDVDATLISAHSEKECAAPTFKRGFGFHPLWAFVDHGPAGSGEPLAFLLRKGNAGSNTVADHKTVIRASLAQLPGRRWRGKQVLVRIDGAGGTHELLAWLTRRRLAHSVGFPLPGDLDSIQAKLGTVPAKVWTPAYDADGEVRPGAWVAELTGLFDLSGWPAGMRLIVRKERPHPGAQLRITDVDGHRVTAFVTNTTRGADRRTGAAAPPPRPGRGPHPLRQRHRADQPATTRLRAEPDLVRHRRTGLRAHRLDADPRPGRLRRPPVGTQAAAATHHPSHTRPHRPAPTAPPGRPPSLGSHRHRGHRPPPPPLRRTRTGPRLTAAPHWLDDPQHHRHVEPAPTRDDHRAACHTPLPRSPPYSRRSPAIVLNGAAMKDPG